MQILRLRLSLDLLFGIRSLTDSLLVFSVLNNRGIRLLGLYISGLHLEVKRRFILLVAIPFMRLVCGSRGIIR